ncbi:N-acetylglucosamine-6-phosphate deacetylase [Alteromonas gracilis]|uniref:N-acetylglucosamine-6-phosphate deacetylase n=1 Tax=Alteromonas gracilis TaxID=1479524 RepID=UPI00321BF71D
MTLSITVQHVLLPSGWATNKTITASNGVITDIRDATTLELKHIEEGYLIPGFFDTQVNGGGGVLFNDKPCVQSVDTMALAHLRYGTTAMLPTIITDNAQTMLKAADAIAQVLDSGTDRLKAVIKGIHFEGPYLSKTKKGVHEEAYIRKPSDAELAILTRKDIGKVLITVAPETVDVGFIKEMVSEGVTVSLGHTNADFEQIQSAIDAGATGFTHLYNAMSALTSREPGAVGAALLNEDTYCGFIVDHYHLHPKSAELALKVKGASRAMLVTDAMAHAGSDVTRLPFFNTEIVREGNKLTTPDGTLAGSCLDMHSALVNTINGCSITLAQASTMASNTPSSFMGLSNEIGNLEVGRFADFVLLSEKNEVKQVFSRMRNVC